MKLKMVLQLNYITIKILNKYILKNNNKINI